MVRINKQEANLPAPPKKCLDLFLLHIFSGISILCIIGSSYKEEFVVENFLRFVVFLKTPVGELNCKLIRSDFEAT